MALDLIKEYLVGIGFNVDTASLSGAEQSIDNAKKKIEDFNDNSNKGFSDTSDSMKDLFSVLGSAGNIGKLFPQLQKPFNSLIKDITNAKKLYKDLNDKVEANPSKKKATNKESNKENNSSKSEKQDVKVKDDKNILDFNFKSFTEGITKTKTKLLDFKNSSKGSLGGVEKSAELLSANGGKSLLGFGLKGAGYLGLIGIAAVAAIAVTKKLVDFLGGLAKQDIENEKLSRQLWTTKENARDIDSALKTLGVTMQDLWLSPTLLKQFNQLRKDSSQLRLPPEFKDNIKVVQGIGLEFKRLKQMATLAFQWIGHYILKYCAGPLVDVKKGLHKFNDGLMKAIPVIAKVIGGTIGIIIRIILTIGKVLYPIFAFIKWKVNFILKLIDKIPKPIKKIIKIIGILIALMATPAGIIVLLIVLLDDLFTFLRGGKSIIGSVFGYFKEKGTNAIASISKKFKNLKTSFKEGMTSIKNDWNEYWDKASETLDKLKNKAKKVWGNIKEWSKGMWKKTKDKFKEAFGDTNSKIEVYNNQVADQSAVPAKYLTKESNNSTTNSNSNNKISNDNKIYVYGSDSKSTANEVNRNLSGINTRNLQGVY